MGRGRAKAKQTKVARRLKYSGGGTDLDRLRRELGAGAPVAGEAEDARLGQVNADVDGDGAGEPRA